MKSLRARVLGWLYMWNPILEWPFMLFLTFVFMFIYVWTVASSVRMREPLYIAVFTLLISIYLGFHWSSFQWIKKGWNIWLFLGIQTLIAFILCSLAAEIGPTFGFYLGVVGVSAGMLRSSRRIAAAVLVILTVSAGNFYWISRGTGMVWWVLVFIPMTIYVVIFVVLYSSQATAREKAQRLLVELEAVNRRLTESADRIEDLTLSNERQRMARELHDTLAQGLAGLVLQLEAADLHLAGGRPERAQTIVQQAMTRARATLAESRRAIDGLRKQPPADLEEAVRAEVDHFETAAGVPCSLEGSLPDSLSAAEQELVVRTVAESLTNIARHANARHARIRLHNDGKTFTIEIVDDGIGFDPGSDPEQTGHYGLTGLRERAGYAGGELEIQSAAGKGSKLRMRIPLSSSKE